ncbi:hypothetical protein [Micropruina sp.]|uniref:hypothetical protein n=1 Tax=Micropruina sp. TaxID=2737536 RepID=UPI0039E5C341
MTPKPADYIEAGEALDADEREIAALALQQVDEEERGKIDAAWDETIDRRLDELASGEVKLGDEFAEVAEAAAALIRQCLGRRIAERAVHNTEITAWAEATITDERRPTVNFRWIEG